MPLSHTMIEKLKVKALESNITHKHACVAMIDKKIISPIFHNYNRCQVFGTTFGSIHSEIAVINYLLNNISRGDYRKKQQCVLQSYEWYKYK